MFEMFIVTHLFQTRIFNKFGRRRLRLQGQQRGVALPLQGAAVRRIEAHARGRQILPEQRRLAAAQPRQAIVARAAKGRLGMADKVNAGHHGAPLGAHGALRGKRKRRR